MAPEETFTIAVELDELAQIGQSAELFEKLPEPARFGCEKLLAFEENWGFLYILGAARIPHAESNEPAADLVLLRRIFIFKPGIFLVDDQVHGQQAAPIQWTFSSKEELQTSRSQIQGVANGQRFRCQIVHPATFTMRDLPAARLGDSGQIEHYQVAIFPAAQRKQTRLVQVMSFSTTDQEGAVLSETKVTDEAGSLRVQLIARDRLLAISRTAMLWLPPGRDAGQVKIIDETGYEEVPQRLLPAGILPAGQLNLALREGWDTAYRDLRLATWDAGGPSSELKRALASDQIKPGRVVELGCGTGSDAVYLATREFDVTAIDISPTALNIAQRKMKAAGVQVHWLLADVLQPPELEAFDFVFDRGCYHEVRRHDAGGYVAGLRKLTRPGTKILVLAGSAGEDNRQRFDGPPGLTEAEIRADFADDFELLWLREFRFDPTPPNQQGHLAWSILLRRK